MHDKKILILKSEYDSFEKYYSKKMRRDNVEVWSTYRVNSGILRILSILWIQVLCLPYKQIWYGRWKQLINQYDEIIVFDRVLGYDVLKYIHSKNSKARLIFWYWNIAQNMIPKEFREYCEVWSFDENDCNKYNFRKNIQFYFIPDKKEMSYKYDVMLIGRDKGRYPQIKKLYDFLEAKGLKLNFKVLSSEKNEKICIDKIVSYEEIIEIIKESRCIVEFTQQTQTGLSARALEALFYKKKLITNNINIKNEKMYSSENVFILGSDDMATLEEFIKTPYREIDDSIRKAYSYDTWIKNFG